LLHLVSHFKDALVRAAVGEVKHNLRARRWGGRGGGAEKKGDESIRESR
jgi:hypothetical protein